MKPALLAMMLLGPSAALAGQCSDFVGGSAALQAADPAARLSFIRDRLKKEAPRARVYTGIWGGGYSLLTLGQLAVIPAVAPQDQVDYYVGALSSFIAAGMLVALPLEVMEDAEAFDGRAANLSAARGPCAALAEAERLFVKDADAEAFGVSWLLHGANVVFNAVVGLVLGLGFGHWETGILNAVVGLALGEAMIFTQPTQLVTDLERYRAGDLAPTAATAMRFGAAAALTPGSFGVHLGATF